MTRHPSTAALLAPDDAVRDHLARCPECRRLAHLANPPERAPRYDRLEPMHHGGMGRTVRAWDRVLDREVLLKELAAPPGLSVNQLRARFEREARLTAALSHPSILSIYDLGEGDDGAPFYAMPLVEGRTLTAEIAATRPASRLELVRQVAAIADAVAYAHARGVVHRDLKPDNVLVGSFGQVVVLDWGLAARIGEETPAGDVDPGDGLTGMGIGTPAYMPPEQSQGGPADPRQDVYAIGATLYHCLTGAPPFSGRSGLSIRAAHARWAPPPPLRALAPRAPPALLSLVERAMATDPAARFPDVRPLAEELRRYLDGALLTSHAYSPWDLLQRWLRRYRAPLGAVGAAAVAASVVGGTSLVQLARSRDEALRELERARAAQASLYAADPHSTVAALSAGLGALAVAEQAGREPEAATVAAMRSALRAGPAAMRVPGLAGWGPLAVARGRVAIADPAGRVVIIGGGEVRTAATRLGHPFSAALSADGSRWLVVDDDGLVQIDGGEPFAAGATLGAWIDEGRVVLAGPDAITVRATDGAVLERRPLAAEARAITAGGGRVLVGDDAGAVHSRAADGTWSTARHGAAAITALALAPDGRAWAGSADGALRSLDGRLIARAGTQVEFLQAAGDCLALVPHEGLTQLIAIGPRCRPGAYAGQWSGLRPDGGAILSVDAERLCVRDAQDGATLACVPLPRGALSAGFVDERLAYVIGFDGALLFDARSALRPHGGEIVGVWPASAGVWTVGREGSVRWGDPATGEDREVTRLAGGVSAAAARGGTLWVGAFDGEWVEVGTEGVRARARLRDGVAAIVPDDGGGWVATLDGQVARFGPGLALARSWEVPPGIGQLVVVPSGLVTLGLDGAARAWSVDGEPGPVHGGPEDDVGGAVSAGDHVWLKTRGATVRWDPVTGEVHQELRGRLVGRTPGGQIVTADPNGTVYVYGADGVRRAQWAEQRPPRAVSSTGLVLGDDGALRGLDGVVVGRGPASVVDVTRVGAWEVSGDVEGGVYAEPVSAEAMRAVACERVAALYAPSPHCPPPP